MNVKTPSIAVAALLAAVLGASVPAAADCPLPGTVIFPGLTGTVLQDSLRVRFRPPVGLDYAGARNVMYGRIDNHNSQVTGIYTGYTVFVDPDAADPKTDAFDAGINTEHTWPQSKGAEHLPMQADLHHIFPSEINANAARANDPFDEIPDDQTDTWYRLKQVTTHPDPALIDEYSELDNSFPGTSYPGRWEPREVKKGDVARAMFYFWTVYRNEAKAADPDFFDVQKDALYAWHVADPADETEYARTCAIADVQAGKVNPFVVDPTLVARAYFPDTPVRMTAFRAEPLADGVRLVWRFTDDGDALGFDVLRGEADVAARLNDALVAPAPVVTFVDRTGRAGAVYRYWIDARTRDGAVERFGPATAIFPTVTVLAADPNPARAGGTTRIRAGVAGMPVAVFDAAGRRVRTGVTGPDGSWRWDGALDSGASAGPGVWFVRAGRGAAARTLKLVRIPG